ncbi:hypothetical protein ACSMXN_15690 [Jatrophihabitans sp. DSM 45814]
MLDDATVGRMPSVTDRYFTVGDQLPGFVDAMLSEVTNADAV